jgi:hypothetical protein
VLCAVSPVAAYGSPAVLYAGAAAALLFMRANTRPTRQAGSRFAHIREGLAYVWTNKIVFAAISLDLCAVLLGGATVLLPVFASDIRKVGAHGFGVLRSGRAIGAGAMAFALTRWPLHRRAGHWMFGGVTTFCVATLVFAVSRSMLVSMIALIALGAADMISVYVRQAVVQLVTPCAAAYRPLQGCSSAARRNCARSKPVSWPACPGRWAPPSSAAWVCCRSPASGHGCFLRCARRINWMVSKLERVVMQGEIATLFAGHTLCFGQ